MGWQACPRYADHASRHGVANVWRPGSIPAQSTEVHVNATCGSFFLTWLSDAGTMAGETRRDLRVCDTASVNLHNCITEYRHRMLPGTLPRGFGLALRPRGGTTKKTHK